MTPHSLITGITGQDGSLIAKVLLESGHRVTGLFRRSSSDNFWRLKELGILDQLNLLEVDIESYGELAGVLSQIQFATIFHLAGSSFTAESFRKPWQTFSVNTFAVFHLLEAVRVNSPESLVVLAGSSEVFGHQESQVGDLVRSASSFLSPINPYGLSHLSNMQVAEYYRNMYGLRIAIPIMFNHESEFRGDQFLTKKLTSGAVRLLNNPSSQILLGNLDAQKDWGSAKEFMNFLAILPESDFVGNFSLGTGKVTSIREIVSRVFEELDIRVEFIGEGLNEKVVNKSTGSVLISVDSRNLRAKETLPYKADTGDCFKIFGAAPIHTVLDILPSMIQFDLKKRV